MCTTRMEWSFGSGTMEVNTGSFCCNGKQPLEHSLSTDREKQPTEKDLSTSVFVNHAAIAWQESRRKWVGDQSRRPKRKAKDPILSWSMAYDDLLLTNEPFSEPIPLPEMVDFLVDIWHDEGLFD